MVYWGTTGGTEDSSDSVGYQNLQASQVGAPPPAANSNIRGNDHVAPGAALTASAVDAARQSAYTGALAMVSAENNMRNQIDSQNAAILGYDSELAAARGYEATAFRLRRRDLIADIEEDRYYVVLMAYDFQAMWRQKKHVLLWVTRFSVRTRGTSFSKVFPAMVDYASQYFGQDSHGLLRKPLPEGRVEVGVPKSIGVVPEK